MKVHYRSIEDEDGVGIFDTFKIGIIKCDFDELVEKLGEPFFGDAESNIYASWLIEFEDETYLSIYKYKSDFSHYWSIGSCEHIGLDGKMPLEKRIYDIMDMDYFYDEPYDEDLEYEYIPFDIEPKRVKKFKKKYKKLCKKYDCHMSGELVDNLRTFII